MKKFRYAKEPNKPGTHKCKKCGEEFRLKCTLLYHKCPAEHLSLSS